MATIVNTPATRESDGGMGFLLGVIALIVFAVLFIYYLLPALQSGFSTSSSPTINVPKDINVNVNQQPK
jgi:hypothetical protein